MWGLAWMWAGPWREECSRKIQAASRRTATQTREEKAEIILLLLVSYCIRAIARCLLLLLNFLLSVVLLVLLDGVVLVDVALLVAFNSASYYFGLTSAFSYGCLYVDRRRPRTDH